MKRSRRPAHRGRRESRVLPVLRGVLVYLGLQATMVAVVTLALLGAAVLMGVMVGLVLLAVMVG